MSKRKTVKITLEYEANDETRTDELLVAALRAVRSVETFDGDWPIFVRASMEDER